MNIPFSLPVIDSDVINEMNDTLTNTGWLCRLEKCNPALRETFLSIGIIQ